MTTIKNILSENRESVISSIKWEFKVWKSEDVKQKMIEFLAYMEKSVTENDWLLEQLSTSKKVKTNLKGWVMSMAKEQKDNFFIERFGTAKPKLREIMGAIHENYELKN